MADRIRGWRQHVDIETIHARPAGGVCGCSGGGRQVWLHILQKPLCLWCGRGQHKMLSPRHNAVPVVQRHRIRACLDAGDFGGLPDLDPGAKMRRQVTHGRRTAKGVPSGDLPVCQCAGLAGVIAGGDEVRVACCQELRPVIEGETVCTARRDPPADAATFVDDQF